MFYFFCFDKKNYMSVFLGLEPFIRQACFVKIRYFGWTAKITYLSEYLVTMYLKQAYSSLFGFSFHQATCKELTMVDIGLQFRSELRSFQYETIFRMIKYCIARSFQKNYSIQFLQQLNDCRDYMPLTL